MNQTVLLQPQSETTVQLTTSSEQTTVVLNTVPQCVVELQQDGEPTTVSLSMIPFIPAPPTQLYVQDNQPVIPVATSGLWIQTGLGEDGSGFTFWVEDGQ